MAAESKREDTLPDWLLALPRLAPVTFDTLEARMRTIVNLAVTQATYLAADYGIVAQWLDEEVGPGEAEPDRVADWPRLNILEILWRYASAGRAERIRRKVDLPDLFRRYPKAARRLAFVWQRTAVMWNRAWDFAVPLPLRLASDGPPQKTKKRGRRRR